MGEENVPGGNGFRQQNSQSNNYSTFYRMIMPSDIQERKLRIPRKFVKKLGHFLPDVATLRTPNGCVWQVGLKRTDGKVFFVDGWYDFVERQSICEDYLLALTYVGNLIFNVNVFNLANAEIKYQSNHSFVDPSFQPGLANVEHGKTTSSSKGLKFQHVKLEAQRETNEASFLDTAKLKRTRVLDSQARSTHDIGIKYSYDELMASAYEDRLHSLSQYPEITRERKQGIQSYESKLSPKPGTTDEFELSPKPGTTVTPKGKERVLNESKTFQSENPFCRVILRQSYVSNQTTSLYIASSFAVKYLGGFSGFVTLQVSSGQKWPVKFMSRDGSATLGKGWRNFVRGNRLKEGDVCVFELVKTEEVVLKVTIFRVAEDTEPCQ